MSQQKNIKNASPSLSVFLGGKTSLRRSFVAEDRMSTMYCSGQSNIKREEFQASHSETNPDSHVKWKYHHFLKEILANL